MRHSYRKLQHTREGNLNVLVCYNNTLVPIILIQS